MYKLSIFISDSNIKNSNPHMHANHIANCCLHVKHLILFVTVKREIRSLITVSLLLLPSIGQRRTYYYYVTQKKKTNKHIKKETKNKKQTNLKPKVLTRLITYV